MRVFFKEDQLILIFFVILTVITVLSNIDVGSVDEKMRVKSLSDLNKDLNNDATDNFKDSQTDKIDEAAENNRNLARRPASQNQNDLSVLQKEFLCKTATPMQNKVSDRVSKNLVAISFKLCYESKLTDRVVLQNQSNGFKAHIFKINKNFFKTDFIQLNSGLNILKLEVFLKDGQKLEESLEILSGT